MAFCLGWPGSNPGTDLGFFHSRIVVILFLFSLGVGLFLIVINRAVHILFLLLYCFLSSYTAVKFLNCILTVLQEKGKNKNLMRPGKALIKKRRSLNTTFCSRPEPAKPWPSCCRPSFTSTSRFVPDATSPTGYAYVCLEPIGLVPSKNFGVEYQGYSAI